MLDIQHVLLMMLENRSFDHYLGALTLEGRADVDGITTPRPSNPSNGAPPIAMMQLETASGPVAIDGKRYFDPPHVYEEVASQLNGQGMAPGAVRPGRRVCGMRSLVQLVSWLHLAQPSVHPGRRRR